MKNYKFCTLFDKNYLSRGLTLYRSLEKTGIDFHIWILTLDDEAYEILQRLNLAKATLIRHTDFQSEELKIAQSNRTHSEYCFSLTPQLPLYIFRTFKDIDMITYLDSDMYFYSSPKPIYDELGDSSVLIIPHRFLPHKKHLEKNGLYNVGMLIFRNDTNGIKCLNWWRERCIESTADDVDNGVVGDQKYLDDFPKLFDSVHVLKHRGANVAPWNIRNYKIRKKSGKIYVDPEHELIFYHFYKFKLYPKSVLLVSSPVDTLYMGRSHARKYLYRTYTEAMYKSIREIKNLQKNFPTGTLQRPRLFEDVKQSLVWKFKNIIKTLLKYKLED